jgi:hypothetical protein
MRIASVTPPPLLDRNVEIGAQQYPLAADIKFVERAECRHLPSLLSCAA